MPSEESGIADTRTTSTTSTASSTDSSTHTDEARTENAACLLRDTGHGSVDFSKRTLVSLANANIVGKRVGCICWSCSSELFLFLSVPYNLHVRPKECYPPDASAW